VKKIRDLPKQKIREYRSLGNFKFFFLKTTATKYKISKKDAK